jgi:hypothetical protein
MNDSSTLEAVRGSLTTARDSLTGVHMTTPLGTIVRQGRARRWRLGLTGLAGAAAVAAGAGFGLTAVLPASHQPGNPGPDQLAAWTVSRQADGHVHLTIRQLSDPAGLQSTLRADGVPASVTFLSQPNPACRLYPHVPKPLPPQHAAPGHATAAEVRELGRMTDGVVRFDPGNPPSVAANRFVIVPSALPSGVGVQIGAAVAHTGASLGFRLVYTSPQCTGS